MRYRNKVKPDLFVAYSCTFILLLVLGKPFNCMLLLLRVSNIFLCINNFGVDAERNGCIFINFHEASDT